MTTKVLFLFLIIAVGGSAYTQNAIDTSKVTAKPLYIDSTFTKTIDTIGNVKLIQYFHQSKTYKGRRMFLGKDEYLLSGELILSSRNDYDNEVTIAYTFFESGEIRSINSCRMNGGCDLIYFFKNGKIKSKYSVNSEGLNSGLWLRYNSNGKLVEKRLYSEEGKLINE